MKLLIVRYSAFGDVILTTGVINFIKSTGLFKQIDILTDKGFSFIFENDVNVNKVLQYDKSLTFWQYLGFLQNEVNDYDYILDLQGKFRTLLLRFFSNSNSIGYDKKTWQRRLFTKFRILEKSLEEHVTERYIKKFIKTFSLEEPDIEALRPVINIKDVKEDNSIVVHPFASKNTKIWPYFDKLVEKLVIAGFSVKVIGQGVRDVFNKKGVINLVNKTDLKEMLEEIKKSKFLITTDSGPLHAGVALGVKTLGIFGSTTRHFGFYPEFKNSYIIENNDVICRPCHVHGLKSCPKDHFDCLKSISVEQVFDKVMDILK
ncbi:glycosyltransferase family 9 protein [Deferribacterales bacterium Es71-Z0220]|jgi:ADP-heptose:LPS heptosyltransferase|uniref:glycosyltransferase family 9 protein n=1 Tax=Deferrivibrio essentukiensis TaxID=2880922 RepID=UPI001F619C99|nr:glycosyltransferase family 9 protein [Deferrivibrio essentukiensis]MBZ4672792.1 heptosyltransferase family protein [Deferribacteraceae bacterium]MCB4205499.1 glycosyltransferase family 9 protein [Deferrivibrio essentukiensis]